MNISELTQAVAAKTGFEAKDTRRVIDAVLQAIVESAQAGEEVSLPAFGKFKVASRQEREGRNPATGEAITIPAAKKLTYSPSKPVKEALNGVAAPSASKAAGKAKRGAASGARA